jgi:CheY-like chemotaxis protein/PAS domain-containing protein
MRTILLVEDNPITRKLVRFTLESKGFTVLEAVDGKSALETVATRLPDLVLLDLMLPDTDGFELAGKLRAILSREQAPIIAFSGFVSKLEEARISAVGFDDVIVKPVEPWHLVQIVQAHLPEPSLQFAEAFGGGRRLLVADDDPIQAKLAAFRLTRLGFDVVCVEDGAEALAAARARVPELLLADIMMPRMDGFRLCLEIRQDPRLRELPVVLMTSSYIDEADRSLARQAGASSFVLRTPGLREVIDAVRKALSSTLPAPKPTLPHAEVEREHTQRVVQQLERQVQMKAGISQRCSVLSAELSILSGISSALTRHEDFATALDQVLAACFDAGGISTGALYLFEQVDAVRTRTFGVGSAWSSEALQSFFGDLERLKLLLAEGSVVQLSGHAELVQASVALSRAGIQSALAVPVSYKDELLGALFLASKTTPLDDEDRMAFATGVASQIAQAIALLRTFSAKAASERAAQETATTLRAMMDSLVDGVIVADSSGKFLYWNAVAEKLVRMGPVDSAPEQWSSQYGLFLADRVTLYPTEQMPLVRAIRGERVERAEMFVRAEGASQGTWLSINAAPLLDAEGQRRGGVSIFRDVTAERAAREQLMVSDRMASIGMLAAGVAHEINNPLAVVVGSLELGLQGMDAIVERCGDGDLVRELRGDLEAARDAAERVRQITRDLRIFSRSDEAKSTNVDVRRVLESSLSMAQNEIRHRATLVTNFGEVRPVQANESRLGQVFLNLVVNAAQAIPEGRVDENEIRVTTREILDRVVVEVRDTGAGIAPDVLCQLFTPFVTTKPAGVGTGLGLTICQRIVTSYGGQIEVETEVGTGTVFRVLLPATSAREAEVTPQLPAVRSNTRRGSVLAIDDDDGILKLVRRALYGEHEVLALTAASQAVRRIEAGARFDVIFCDLMMPRVTGMDLHVELSRIAPDQAERVVFLTAGAFTSRARAFLESTSNLRIEKPFSLASLRAFVNERVR